MLLQVKFSAVLTAPLPVGGLAADTVAVAGIFHAFRGFHSQTLEGRSQEKSVPLCPPGCPQGHMNEINQ